MHEVQIIAIDDPVTWASISQSLCFAGWLCKTAERIDVLCGVKIGLHPHENREGSDVALAKLLLFIWD